MPSRRTRVIWRTSSASSTSKTRLLVKNYRSYSNIPDCANALISHNSKLPGEEPAHQPGPGRAGAALRSAPAIWPRYWWMVDEIKQLVRKRWLHAPGNCRALPRNARKSRAIESALFNSGIPTVYGGLRFFERAWKPLRSWPTWRLPENPHDDTSLLARGELSRIAYGDRRAHDRRQSWQDTAQQQRHLAERRRRHGRGRTTAGTQLQGLQAQIGALREQTRRAHAGAKSSRTLGRAKRPDRALPQRVEGRRDRIENFCRNWSRLSFESFVTQAGFGRDAMPLDEQQKRAAAEPVAGQPGWTRISRCWMRALKAPVRAAFHGQCRYWRDAAAAAGLLVHAALEAGDNQAQAGQDAAAR